MQVDTMGPDIRTMKTIRIRREGYEHGHGYAHFQSRYRMNLLTSLSNSEHLRKALHLIDKLRFEDKTSMLDEGGQSLEDACHAILGYAMQSPTWDESLIEGVSDLLTLAQELSTRQDGSW
jgi:hypothetical protein